MLSYSIRFTLIFASQDLKWLVSINLNGANLDRDCTTLGQNDTIMYNNWHICFVVAVKFILMEP
jgi:hypothetical protein